MKKSIVMKIGGLVTALGLAISMISSLNMSSSAFTKYDELSETKNILEYFNVELDESTYKGQLFFAKGEQGYNLYTYYDPNDTKGICAYNVYTEQSSKWSVKGNTLTLNGLDVYNKDGYGLTIVEDANIRLAAGSVNNIRSKYGAILATRNGKNIKIDGDGTLNLYSEEYGFCSKATNQQATILTDGKLDIDGGNINIYTAAFRPYVSGHAQNCSGIMVSNFTLNNGNVNVVAHVYKGEAVGVSAHNLQINNGNIDIEVEKINTIFAERVDLCGLGAGNVEINGGKVSINGALSADVVSTFSGNVPIHDKAFGGIVAHGDGLKKSFRKALIINGGKIDIYCRSKVKNIVTDAYAFWLTSEDGALFNGGNINVRFDISTTSEACVSFLSSGDYRADFIGGQITYEPNGTSNYFNKAKTNQQSTDIRFGDNVRAYCMNAGAYDIVTSFNSAAGKFYAADGKSTTSSVQIREVSNERPPVIVNQSNGSTYTDGDNVTLFVELNKNHINPVTYKWEKDGKVLEGENKSTLDLVMSSATAGTYKCTVSDGVGHYAHSEDIVVEVFRKLTASNLSGSGSYNNGDEVKLTFTPQGGDGSYSYSWTKLIDGKFASVSSNKTNELVFNFDSSTGTQQKYRCTVKDSAGRATLAEFVIGLNGVEITEKAEDFVVNSSQSRVYYVGSEINLTASALGGTAPYTYKWTRYGSAVEGGDTNALTLNASSLTAGTYVCTATDSNGRTAKTSDIVITVTYPLSVSLQSSEMTCDKDSEALLHVQAEGGTAPYTYQWTRNGVAVSGANSCDLTTIVTDDTIGTYKCKIRDKVGREVYSNDIVVSMTEKPVVDGNTKSEEDNVKPVAELKKMVNNESNAIAQQITIYNGGETEVDLSKVEVRYYFSSDSVNGAFYQTALVSGILAGGEKANRNTVVGSVVKMANPTDTADSYVKITYLTDGKLVSANDYVQTIFFIMSPTADTTFNPTNDYSYINNDIAVFYDGKLVSGSLPQ